MSFSLYLVVTYEEVDIRGAAGPGGLGRKSRGRGGGRGRGRVRGQHCVQVGKHQPDI